MRNLMEKEISSVSGGFRGTGWVTVYKDSIDGDSGGSGEKIRDGGGKSNKVRDVCNNTGGAPYPDSATVTVTYAQTGTLNILGNGTSAINTISVTANCGDARKSSN